MLKTFVTAPAHSALRRREEGNAEEHIENVELKRRKDTRLKVEKNREER